MSEIINHNELEQDEEESTSESKIHPDIAECAGMDPEDSDHADDDDQIFDPPESVLYSSPGILRALDVEHDDAHQQEEEGHNQVEPVDRLVAHSLLAVQESHGVAYILIDHPQVFVRLAKGDTLQTVLYVRISSTGPVLVK